jgi:hypothetical protein
MHPEMVHFLGFYRLSDSAVWQPTYKIVAAQQLHDGTPANTGFMPSGQQKKTDSNDAIGP